MAQEIQKGIKKRNKMNENSNFRKSRSGGKVRRVGSGAEDVKVKKMDKKMWEFFRKKARDYNSDDDDDGDEGEENIQGGKGGLEVEKGDRQKLGAHFSDDEQDAEDDNGVKNDVLEDKDGEIQPGLLRFSEGCKAFSVEFNKIMKKAPSIDDALGPVLSAQNKLVAENLAEDEAERKVKSVAKKEKHMVGEKGHVKPANYLDSHEKFLIGVATRGVVKLFNAVNKAQHAQKGLNPSRSKDEKVIKKRRKEAFFTSLGQTPSKQAGALLMADSSVGTGSSDAPAWAPLRDNYMLTNSKLQDWDKMPETTAIDDFGLPADANSSSDADDD